MTDAIPVYTIKRLITDTDADIRRRQKLSSMFAMFQDIAAMHAENLGAGVNWLYKELNVAWILMRIRVEIDKYPVLADEVTVETWPQKPRALYERDYRILDKFGIPYVRAASTWVIMNLATREIKRDSFLDYFNIEILKERAINKIPGRLKPIKDADAVYEKEIKYSDVDYNGHVNNAKYVDFIMDAYPIEEHLNRDIKAIEVHYVSETSPGKTLVFRKKPLSENSDYIDCMRKDDEALVFSALVEWE